MLADLGDEIAEGRAELMPTCGREYPTVFNLDDWTCGTAGCMVGYALFSPTLRKEGLEACYGYVSGELVPMCGGYTDWKAVYLFLELQPVYCEYLLCSPAYEEGVGPKDVADRIRAFVAQSLPVLVEPDILVPA